MQTNDLKALTIPEGNVLSVYSNGPGYPINNYYPIANAFNPDNYEKETEVEIVTVVVRTKNVYVGKNWVTTIILIDGTVGTDGYVPILYDRMNGVVTNVHFAWIPTRPERVDMNGRALWPKGERVLDVYVITPEQKLIGPTSIDVTVR